MNQKELTSLKQKIKSRKPEFLRDGYNNLPRLKDKKWRKPKGIHSKLRHGFAGHRSRVEPGFGTPAQLRGFGKTGLRQVLVQNPSELEKINNKQEGIIIASVGTKNKVEIIKKANEKNITILNLKNSKEFLAKVEEELKKRKDSKKTKEKSKEEKAKTREKEAEKKSKETAPPTQTEEDTKKEQEKKELDKVLTQKDA